MLQSQLRSKEYTGMGLHFGAVHLHISNGNTKTPERNPSHDSNGLFAGSSWDLKKERNGKYK
jgi:hypothetical protein